MQKRELKNQNRIIEIDLLRGIAVLFMILDHFFFDIFGLMPFVFSDFPARVGFSNQLYRFATFYWEWDVRVVVRYFIVFLFMGLVGICSSFSKSNIKRGAKLMGVSLVLTLATFIISKVIQDPSSLITFGTLHCIALSLILIGILDKFTKNKWIYLALGLVMVGVGGYLELIAYTISYGDENILIIILKQIIGLIECGGDTMPLLLNGGQVFIGFFIGKSLYSRRESIFKKKYSNNIITFIGRNSLVVYFLHQLLIPLILGIILLTLGFHLAF